MLTIAKRRILYVCFTVTFFLSGAVILFFASGYRYLWSQRLVYRPGLLVAEVSPRPDAVFLNAEKKDVRGDVLRIRGVTPGLHVVRFEREGYFPLEERVAVESGTVTNLGNLRLFRKDVSRTLHENLSRVSFSDATKATAGLTKNPTSLILLDQETGAATPLLDRVNGTVDDLFWTPNADAIVLRKTENAIQSLILVSPAGAATTIPLAIFSTDVIRWSATQRDQIYVLRSGTLSVYSRLTGAMVVLATDVLDWMEREESLYLIATNGDIVLRRSQSGQPQTSIVGRLQNKVQPAFVRPSPEQLLTIIDPATRTLSLLPLDGRRAPTEYRNIATASWSPDFRLLLFGSDFELSVRTVESAAEPILLRRSSKAFDGGWWIPESPYVLIHQEDALILHDTNSRTSPLVFARTGPIPPLVHIDATNELIIVFSEGLLRALSF